MKVHAPAVPALAVLALLAFSTPSAAQCAPGTLSPSSGVGGDKFGFSVDVDANGIRAVVGAPLESAGVGAAYVYDWSGSAWVEVAKLTGTSPLVISQFGYSVAVSGNRIVVGAPFSTPGGFGNPPGTAFVFERQVDGTWSQVAELTFTAAGVAFLHPATEFGKSVDIQGNTIIVGLPAFGYAQVTGSPPTAFGAVNVYQAPFSGLMTEFAHLDRQDLGTASIGGMLMGEAVRIDGGTIVAGAPSGCNPNTGRVFVFELLLGDWSTGLINKAVLTSSDPEAVFCSGGYGAVLDISGDTIVASDYVHTLGFGGSTTFGKVYIHEKSGSTWVDATETASLSAIAAGQFGRGLAIDEVEGVLLVGEPGGAGTGHVYQNVGGVWTSVWSLSPTFGVGGPKNLGFSAAMGGDHKFFGLPLNSGALFPHGAVLDWNTPLATGTATVRTGDLGINPLSYASVNAPTIGKNWDSTVDIVTPGALSSFIAVGLGGPWSGTAVSGLLTGEFLIQLVPDPIVVDFAPGVHSLPVPPFCNLIGVPLSTQAATFAPFDIRLTNALDLVFGSI